MPEIINLFPVAQQEPAVRAAEDPTSAPPETAEDWAEVIRHDLATGTAAYISAGRKFIEAKQALKRTNGSFTHLVTDLLGYDLDTVERWMEIARHPVLSDSANSRILPTAWTTLYTLSRIAPELLAKYIADGTVHGRLSGKAATQLLKRGANGGRNPDGDGDREERRDGDGHGDDRANAHDRDGDRSDDHQAPDSAIGPNSQGEIERKLARLEELEREQAQWEIERHGYDREVEELKAKLGPETPLRSQRRLFQQVLRALKKSEVPGTLDKEVRFLKQSALTDLVELVRSAIRDGLKPERLDLVYRPEVH
jgi:hypothetical protein